MSRLRKRLRSDFRVSSVIRRAGDAAGDTTRGARNNSSTKLDYRPGCNSAVTFITRAIVAAGLHAAVLTRSLSHGEWSYPRTTPSNPYRAPHPTRMRRHLRDSARTVRGEKYITRSISFLKNLSQMEAGRKLRRRREKRGNSLFSFRARVFSVKKKNTLCAVRFARSNTRWFRSP